MKVGESAIHTSAKQNTQQKIVFERKKGIERNERNLFIWVRNDSKRNEVRHAKCVTTISEA